MSAEGYTPTVISEEFGTALALAQGEMETVTRNATNPAFKRGNEVSRYSDISAVLETVKPPLNKHGIALTMPAVNSDDGAVGAYLELRFKAEVLVVPPFWVKPASGIAHALVAALTYSRRAGVTSYFSIPQEDDDGNTASDHGGAEKRDGAVSVKNGAGHMSAENADILVNQAAAKEAAEREEALQRASVKEAADAAAKEASRKFTDVARRMGYEGPIKPLAQAMCRTDKPTTKDLEQAIVLRSADWNVAIDSLTTVASATMNADFGGASLDDAPVSVGDSTATIGAISR